MTKTNNQVVEVVENTKSDLDVLIDKINETSKNTQKIRLALNYYKSIGSEDYRSKVVKLLQKLGVTSKEGNNISYQYVRNIELQVLTSK